MCKLYVFCQDVILATCQCYILLLWSWPHVSANISSVFITEFCYSLLSFVIHYWVLLFITEFLLFITEFLLSCKCAFSGITPTCNKQLHTNHLPCMQSLTNYNLLTVILTKLKMYSKPFATMGQYWRWETMDGAKCKSCTKNMIYNFHHALRGPLPPVSDQVNGELNNDYHVEGWYRGWWGWAKKVTWVLCSE